jgi:cell fate (sporulation/competence/biofilm development) regulator YmcA (YheA/YmcA/DUF963 family)
MAETAETIQVPTESTKEIKLYPSTEEDIQYEKEISDAIKKLPLEQRLQAIAINFYQLKKKRLDDVIDREIDQIINKYNSIQAPIAERVINQKSPNPQGQPTYRR